MDDNLDRGLLRKMSDWTGYQFETTNEICLANKSTTIQITITGHTYLPKNTKRNNPNARDVATRVVIYATPILNHEPLFHYFPSIVIEIKNSGEMVIHEGMPGAELSPISTNGEVLVKLKSISSPYEHVVKKEYPNIIISKSGIKVGEDLFSFESILHKVPKINEITIKTLKELWMEGMDKTSDSRTKLAH